MFKFFLKVGDRVGRGAPFCNFLVIAGLVGNWVLFFVFVFSGVGGVLGFVLSFSGWGADFEAGGDHPLARLTFEALIQVDVEAAYRVRINGTTYGDRFRDPGEMLTSNRYNPRVFYEGIQAEAPGPCAETENYY